MVRLLAFDFFDLLGHGSLVGRGFHVTDDAEGNGEVGAFHEGELQLQRVVLAVCVVDEDVFLGNAVFADFDDLQAEAFLHEAVLTVFAEDERFTVFDVDGVLGASFTCVDVVVCTVVEDDTVLKHFDNGCAFVGGSSLEHADRAFGIGGHTAGEEASACSEAEFCRMEGVFDRTVG